MNILTKIQEMGPKEILKYALILLLAVVVLNMLLPVVKRDLGWHGGGIGLIDRDDSVSSVVPAMDGYYQEEMGYGGKMGAPELGLRNVSYPSPWPPRPGYSTGDDAEAFEVKDYSVTYETGNAARECDAVLALKGREDVIFENVNEHDRGCYVTFKVKKGSVEEVLGILKGLDPKDLSENAYTIKQVVIDYTSQEDALKKRLATIDETLTKAIAAYDEVTLLATRTQDAEALSRIIESKLNMIERLTAERTSITAQLDELSRAKAQELDRLDYTFFNVSVYENAYVDGEEIRNSWKMAVQQAVRDINGTIQDLSVGLVALFLFLLKYVLYAAILLIVAKFGWKYAREIWNR
jgi:hypothetical protein